MRPHLGFRALPTIRALRVALHCVGEPMQLGRAGKPHGARSRWRHTSRWRVAS